MYAEYGALAKYSTMGASALFVVVRFGSQPKKVGRMLYLRLIVVVALGMMGNGNDSAFARR